MVLQTIFGEIDTRATASAHMNAIANLTVNLASIVFCIEDRKLCL